MNYIQAIILAIIEGITEFLPISSTGHMIIGSSVMGIAQESFTKTFSVAIQFGAILSVIVLYWRKFFQSINFYKKLIVAFIPAVLFGVLFKKQINMMLGNVIIVAVMLLAGGIVFLLLDKWFHRAEEKGSNELHSDASAFKIGLFQVIAMIPGVSRSAATIIGGLTQNLNKRAAAEFSFFLAVPTMFAATCKELFDLYKEGGGISSDQVNLLIVGNAVAFIVAVIAIKAFINYLIKHGFKIFGYYRIVAGLTILILYLAGIDLSMI
jgi:undecaprenyl-diphosphatase